MARASKIAKRDTSLVGMVAELSFAVKVAILIFTLFIIFAVFYFLYFKPFQAAQSQLVSQIKTLETEATKDKKTAAKHKKLEEYVLPLEVTHEYYQNFLPKEEETPELIELVNDIGVGVGVRVISFLPVLPAKENDYYRTIDLNLTLEGPYLNLMYFLFHLSNMERFIVIKNIQFSGFKLVGSSLVMTVQCNGSTYMVLGAKKVVENAAKK